MTYITYSQPKLKSQWDKRIRRIFDIVKTKATPDLWIKVLIYRDKEREFNGEKKIYKIESYRGHYRYAEFGGHGFYEEEWDFIRKHPKIKHCITLKIGESCDDEDIAHLIAHEYRHYLQYKKYGTGMNPRLNNGSRAVQVERDARKWENKRMSQLIASHQIKHKEKHDGFIYYRFVDGFKKLFSDLEDSQ